MWGVDGREIWENDTPNTNIDTLVTVRKRVQVNSVVVVVVAEHRAVVTRRSDDHQWSIHSHISSSLVYI